MDKKNVLLNATDRQVCVFPWFPFPLFHIRFGSLLSTCDLWLHLLCFSVCPAKFMTDGNTTERQREKEKGRKLNREINKINR